jgi:hypothetical protein
VKILFSQQSRFVRAWLPVALFAMLGFLVMGYHPGAEDDGIYLSAIKADLNPSLFPHDADFFRLQMRTSFFDNWMASFVHGTGMPLVWAELLWQWISIVLIVWACWTLVCQLFEDVPARWGGLAMFAAMFTLPVAGTALYIVDQYLHPRNPATALILFAVSRVLARKAWQALPLVVLAFLLHPLMGALGISFCSVLVIVEPLQLRFQVFQRAFLTGEVTTAVVMIPFGWILDPPSKTWLDALHSRYWFRLYQWEWYEWLGVIGPMAIFWLIARMARRRGEQNLARLSLAVLVYSSFQLGVAMIILGPPSLIGMSALEPMRYLHLVYVFLALVSGAYLGRYLLRRNVWRWAIFLLLANGGMFLTQRDLFAGSPHLELPGFRSSNPWLQAFDWVKDNTPQDAYFTLDPNYMGAPGEDYHSFRALAERSQLSDAIKDTSVVTKVPELGPVWHEQQLATDGWSHFQLHDFERLKSQFGVDWAIVAFPAPVGLKCAWHNGSVSVCRIP